MLDGRFDLGVGVDLEPVKPRVAVPVHQRSEAYVSKVTLGQYLVWHLDCIHFLLARDSEDAARRE